MENTAINFPPIDVKPDKNGKINTSAELFMSIIMANTPETLKKYTTVQFAEAVVKQYKCSNRSVNGACQFLRGVVNGSKLEFEFEFSDARPIGAITMLKAQNEKLINALKAAGIPNAELEKLLNQ